jgi:transposase
MMGTKTRTFAPLPDDLSLEDLLPEDHFYRRLEAALDLSFVRELVGPLYANGGRPSVDPVVFFKLQLVMFFEDLRSERQLMRVVCDRLSLRWYLGYDLDEPLPDHSSLTRIRERFGLEAFRRFFERIVEECFEALGWYGARSCSSTPPRWRPTPRSTRRGRARWWRVVWRSTWRGCSPRGCPARPLRKSASRPSPASS